MVQQKNLYTILQIDPGVSQDAVEMAYRRLALRFHPDLNHSREATLIMQEINQAYDTLRSPQKRAVYDKHIPKTSTQPSRPRSSAPVRPAHTKRARSTPAGERSIPRNKPAARTIPQEQLILFYLDQQSFGFTIQDVRTIMLMQPIQPMDEVPEFIEGVIRVNGSPLPVVDLRKHLGLKQAEFTREARIILAQIDDAQVGLAVDSVENFLRVSGNTVISPPSIPGNNNPEFIKGFARIGFNLVTLLNLEGLFTRQQKEIIEVFN